jgi:hypothetical protein
MDVTDMVVEAMMQADPGTVRTISDTVEIYACCRRIQMWKSPRQIECRVIAEIHKAEVGGVVMQS